MQISYNWLKELVDFNFDAPTLANRLTLIGTAVESVTPVAGNLENIVVGKIVACEPHPQSDHLKVCRVKIGQDVQMTVVCGAPNVRVGMKAVMALPGATLSDGLRITSAEKLGVVSEGMLCSQKELGLSDDHSGIMDLESTLKSGSDIKTALNLDDYSLSFDLTPNRGDCLSVIGIAREISALTGGPLKKPAIDLKEIANRAETQVEVVLDDLIGCPRYAARVIKGVRLGESPWWMQQRLLASGIRAINNIVDITNYVMLEYGHPLHAFDLENFAQPRVLVRRAAEGEVFRTLDGVDRKLSADVLLITDSVKPVAIAGIMGGEFSEVTGKTTTVLLEGAYFDPAVIRRGRKFLGLTSESQMRFERGTDPNIVLASLDRAANLMEKFAGGKVFSGVVDNYPEKIPPVKLELRPGRVNQILATEMSSPSMIDILKSLEFKVSLGKNLTVEVPTFRPDVTREIDIIEEIARIYGYDRIPVRTQSGGKLLVSRNPREEFTAKVRQSLITQGYFEVVANSIVDPKQMRILDPAASGVEILNPISEDLKWLRPSLIAGLLNVVRENISHQVRNVKVFEAGTVFQPVANQVPIETQSLALALSGSDLGENWTFHPGEFTFHDLQGGLECVEALTDAKIAYTPAEHPAFDSKCCFDLWLGDDRLGVCGKMETGILRAFGIKTDVFVAEVNLDVLLAKRANIKTYRQLPRFPTSERDMAIVVDETVPCYALLDCIRRGADQTLKDVIVFDMYRGKQIEVGMKSLAFRLVFQDESKTLTDAEIESVYNRIVNLLKAEHRASLRT
jgi:phenylalanyl-tRNA synthetase beta chain